MTLDDIPLFSMLKGRLGYLNQRQQVIAQNVANSDTPGFTPKDLKPFTIQKTSAGRAGPGHVADVQTSAMHMRGTIAASRGSSAWKPNSSPDSETRMDGNSVVLEEEMMKMQDSRLNYETALGIYPKSIAMIQMAIKEPGK